MKNRKCKPLIIQENLKKVVIEGFNTEETKIIKNALNAFDSDIVVKDFLSDTELNILIVPSHYSPSIINNNSLVTVYKVNIDDYTYTAAQKELNASDWEMIKELEKLLPEDNALRIKRNQLRTQVSQEIYNWLNPVVSDSDSDYSNSSAP